MKISIIIPVYNAAPYLNRCLTSVLEQTCKNIEVVLIDDCSTDNSYEILQLFQKKDERIRLYQNEKNSLIGVSRNFGIKKAASGDYIWFVDADGLVGVKCGRENSLQNKGERRYRCSTSGLFGASSKK